MANILQRLVIDHPDWKWWSDVAWILSGNPNIDLPFLEKHPHLFNIRHMYRNYNIPYADFVNSSLYDHEAEWSYEEQLWHDYPVDDITLPEPDQALASNRDIENLYRRFIEPLLSKSLDREEKIALERRSEYLSQNPFLTWEFVQQHREIDWYIDRIARNKTVTIQTILDNEEFFAGKKTAYLLNPNFEQSDLDKLNLTKEELDNFHSKELVKILESNYIPQDCVEYEEETTGFEFVNYFMVCNPAISQKEVEEIHDIMPKHLEIMECIAKNEFELDPSYSKRMALRSN